MLADAVSKARDSAEAGARAALEQLAVHETAAYPHLTGAQRDLRKRLRIHGRGLGDNLNGGKNQTMDRLVEEVAYEHWHRMLFARFLAENGLLRYPDPDVPVPVTLAECDELAEKEGAANGWELAARFASRMLPQIFRQDSPVFSVTLPPEHQQSLTKLVTHLPVEVFTASDSLGWIYQYWQSKRKDEVNASEVKIGARELPAVTQLFTEPYMVSFLLDNSLGAWWAGRKLTEADLKSATTEQELRDKAALPGMPLQYLRFIREDGAWTPAAGTFSSWPQHLNELKTMDPCCGSGHFLVAAFQMLVLLRMGIEGLSPKDAADRVLTENLHGLDIDRRVTEIAAFALAMAAWRFPGAGGYRPLPPMNIACSGLALNGKREDWEAIAGTDRNLRVALGWMHDAFKDAPVLGSLLNPRNTDAAKLVEWDKLSAAIEQAMAREQTDEQHEAAIAAQGIATAGLLLRAQYQLVVTNVPYLQRGKQCERLRDACEQSCSIGKGDLATVFVNRCLEFCQDRGGTASMVLPQNWLFLASYRRFRERLLKNESWHLLGRLCPGAFETVTGEVVKAILLTLGRGSTVGQSTALFGASEAPALIRGIDVSSFLRPAEKATALAAGELKSIGQNDQLKNPQSVIVLEAIPNTRLLEELADAPNGMHGGDSVRFRLGFWEILDRSIWSYFQSTSQDTRWYGGRENVFYWPENGKIHRENPKAFVKGERVWGKMGVVVSVMASLPVTIYTG